MHTKGTGTLIFGDCMRSMVRSVLSNRKTTLLVSHKLMSVGPFVRYGPNSISINTNTALKDIYGLAKNVRKSKFYSVFPPNQQTYNTHNSIDKISHGRKRRVLSNAFSVAAMKSMEEHILRHGMVTWL
jgi:hypothetical protein